jgi:hypothetical protein
VAGMSLGRLAGWSLAMTNRSPLPEAAEHLAHGTPHRLIGAYHERPVGAVVVTGGHVEARSPLAVCDAGRQSGVP